MRGIWRQYTCRQRPIMRFDRCFVPSFLYFELYAISSIKLFRHQLYLYARQSGPMRICPASCRYLRTFYTFYRAVLYIYNFLFREFSLYKYYMLWWDYYIYTYSKIRTITIYIAHLLRRHNSKLVIEFIKKMVRIQYTEWKSNLFILFLQQSVITLNSYLEIILQKFNDLKHSNFFLDSFIFSVTFIVAANELIYSLYYFSYILYVDFIYFIFLYLVRFLMIFPVKQLTNISHLCTKI